MQASLREEVLSVLGGRRVPTAADVAQMPLLKATIKEVLRWESKGFLPCLEKHLVGLFQKLLFFRLYPVIPANARVITEGDIQVGGYLIPKNVSVSRENVHRHAALI